MKVEVILHTPGVSTTVVGHAEADTVAEMQEELPAVLRKLADALESALTTAGVNDAPAEP